MTVVGSTLDRLPDFVPDSRIRTDQTIRFEALTQSTPRTVYQLSKGPATRLESVSGFVNGTKREFDVGSEVEIRDTTGDGQLDSVAFIDATYYPDVGSDFEVTYVVEPIIKRYTEAFDKDLDSVGDKLTDGITNKYIRSAEGIELDLLGEGYGELGSRQGRKDDVYRQYLQTIVRAFGARGTKDDILFATSGLFRVEENKIEIREDYDQVGYSIRVPHPDIEIALPDIDRVFDLISPTGVELTDPVTLFTEHTVGIETSQVKNSIITHKYSPAGRIPNIDSVTTDVLIDTTSTSTDVLKHEYSPAGRIPDIDSVTTDVLVDTTSTSTDILKHEYSPAGRIPVPNLNTTDVQVDTTSTDNTRVRHKSVVTSSVTDSFLPRHKVSVQTASTDEKIPSVSGGTLSDGSQLL